MTRVAAVGGWIHQRDKIIGRKFSLNATSQNDLASFPIFLRPPNGTEINVETLGRTGQNSIVWHSRSGSGFISHSLDEMDAHIIQLPIEGRFSRKEGKREYVARSGVGLLSPVRSSSLMIASSDLSVVACAIDNNALISAFRSIFDPECINVPAFSRFSNMKTPGMQVLQKMLIRIVSWPETDEKQFDAVYPLMEEMLIFQLIGCWPLQTETNPESADGGSHVLVRASDYIEAHIGRTLTVVEVANAAGTSVRTLQKVFRQRLGCSPVQYIIDQRLTRVHQDLLTEGDVTLISQIAYRWGFVHLSDFTRRFKARYGKSPSELIHKASI
ncbi:AraC family transcriptional regulator [uncultured Cohaesibacter sp.]|uniref:helix-turn-helix transcriptional regulator n=1 Tax=uncultured Cohaesibacter sp. TaxID=1002546 RepID=UPI0029C74EF3|nr:AraC family transcriptional regulator [uncultured Cohaesibacter sp.]